MLTRHIRDSCKCDFRVGPGDEATKKGGSLDVARHCHCPT